MTQIKEAGLTPLDTSTEAVDLTCVCERLADARAELEALKAKLSESEALLAKAVEALGTALSEMVDYADTHPAWSEIWEAREAARTTLAELSSNTTGGKDE